VFEDATTLNNVNAAGVAVVELNATAGGARVLDRLSATAGGSVKSAADGYTNFEKYRGVYLKGPAAGQPGALPVPRPPRRRPAPPLPPRPRLRRRLPPRRRPVRLAAACDHLSSLNFTTGSR
jgi:hypothetical protein